MFGGAAMMDTFRNRLLELHRALLEAVRIDYERANGRVESAGALLQLVTRDAAFAWLHPLSKLIVDLDDPEVVPDAAAGRALAEPLLTGGSDFHARYLEVLQTAPAVVLAHAYAIRALKALPTTKPQTAPRVSA
jgi:hypothetical protein